MKPFQKAFVINRSLLFAALATVSLFLAFPDGKAQAQEPLTLSESDAKSIIVPIGREQFDARSIDVRLWPGRATVIDFSPMNNQTGEVVTYINLGDPSLVVYTTDTPLEARTATTVLLKLIEELNFEGSTRARQDVTNLIIKTITRTGEIRTYSFNIVPSSGIPKYSGLSIHPFTPGVEPTWQVAYGKVATLSDIERGLAVAIERGYSKPDDPVVFKINEFLALSWNGTPIRKAAEQVGLSPSIISSLAKLGIEQRTFSTPPRAPIAPHQSTQPVRALQ